MDKAADRGISCGRISFTFRPYVANLYSGTKVCFDTVSVVYEKNSIAPYEPFHTDNGVSEGGVIDRKQNGFPIGKPFFAVQKNEITGKIDMP